MKIYPGNEQDRQYHENFMRFTYVNGHPRTVGHQGPNVAGCKACQRRIRARINRQARNDAFRSAGMVPVRGNLGGRYWE